jgi:hypothetical protein
MELTDYVALIELYGIQSAETCRHVDADVMTDGEGAFFFHCQQCGMSGVADYECAVYLGWTE